VSTPGAGWGQQPWGAPQHTTQPQDFAHPPYGRPAFDQPAFGQPAFDRPAFDPPPAAPPQRSARRWLPLVGGIVAVLVAALSFTDLFGAGEPELGDCVRPDGSTFDQVDCDDAGAQARIIGTDDDMTGAEVDATDPNQLCTETPSATVGLWSGSADDADGTVLCAQPL